MASTDHALFIKNMYALWRVDPRLAQRIDEVPDERRLAVVPTKSGAVTASMDSGGRSSLLHSRYDPEAEAGRLIDGVPMSDKFCFVVLGMGLGFHVRELFRRLRGDEVIIVFEPSLELLSTALAHVDLSDVIASGRLVVFDRLEKPELHEKLKPHNTLIMLGVQFVAHPALIRCASEFHDRARRMMTDFIAYSRMTLLTLVGNAQVTCRNIAHNLPRYLATPPINVLRNRFSGYPAIIVSGGPSLRKNMDLLAEVKGWGVLIAVQSLFKPLLERGIVPDFVTTLDFHALSRQFFDGLECAGDVHVIAEPKVSWHVMDAYAGPVSMPHSSFAEQLIGPALARRDVLRPGATVAHLAFYLAEYMGCSPIIFVGQDLAFTGHCFYVPGVETHRTWRSEIHRFNAMETREWERIVRNREILRKVPDVFGREIYTDELLLTYLEQFERDFAVSTARVIDATEGGALKQHTEAMTLRQAIDGFCTRRLPADAFGYRSECQWNDTSKLTAGKAEIEDRIREIERIESVCDEMLSLLEELRGLTEDPPRFNRRLVRVDELRCVVAHAHRAYKIVNSATQMAELQRYSADRRLAAAGDDGPPRALRQIERDVRFVQAMREGSRTVLEMLHISARRFDEVLSSPRPSPGKFGDHR